MREAAEWQSWIKGGLQKEYRNKSTKLGAK